MTTSSTLAIIASHSFLHVAMRSHQLFQESSLLFMRIVIASIFLVAAYAKLSMWTGTPVTLRMSNETINFMRFISVAEALGGAAVLIGLLTRLASSGLAIIMVGAICMLQFSYGVGFTSSGGTGWNFPLIVLCGCLILVAFGAGRWSLDAMIQRKKT